MKLQWTRAARADRGSIYEYIEAENPRAAIDLDERFDDIADRLIDLPHLGRPGRVQGTRELVAHRNYVLVYEIGGDAVRVLHVLHAARRWP